MWTVKTDQTGQMRNLICSLVGSNSHDGAHLFSGLSEKDCHFQCPPHLMGSCDVPPVFTVSCFHC